MKKKKIFYQALCFLLLFNFSRCVPDYRSGIKKDMEIVLPDGITDQIRKDAATKIWEKKGKRK